MNDLDSNKDDTSQGEIKSVLKCLQILSEANEKLKERDNTFTKKLKKKLLLGTSIVMITATALFNYFGDEAKELINNDLLPFVQKIISYGDE